MFASLLYVLLLYVLSLYALLLCESIPDTSKLTNKTLLVDRETYMSDAEGRS